MARPSRTRALGVWQNGILVGRWSLQAGDKTEFSYDPGWIASDEARPLSLSLPIDFDGAPLTGPRVAAYFDNLLPDSESIRARIQARYQTTGRAAFDLLAAIGRDCVGAVQLLPEGEAPEDVASIHARALDPLGVEGMLNAVARPGVLRDGDDADDFRISLAGAQEKHAFIRHRQRWCVPRGSTPSTHIFKLPLGLVGNRALDLTHSLENEWLCARLLRHFSVPVAECELARFGRTRALVVTRFDRKLHPSKKYWLRLPQEDFCQATGTPSSRKYEADGGPGLLDIAEILHSSEAREADLRTLLRAELLFFLLAATDGHAKNFSIHLLPGGRFRLTPLYDVISAWPIAGAKSHQIHPSKLKLAMSLHGTRKHYRLAEVGRRHFDATARAAGVGGVRELMDEILAGVPHAVESVGADLPAGFPEQVFSTITRGLTDAARRLVREPR